VTVLAGILCEQTREAQQILPMKPSTSVEEIRGYTTPAIDHVSPDEDTAARDALRTEALSWGIKAAEVEHILTHHTDIGKARSLLWRARRPVAKTLVTAGS
jgi:hypothetical protein